MFLFLHLSPQPCLWAVKTQKPLKRTVKKLFEQVIAGRYGDTLWNVADEYDPASFNFLLGDRDSLDAILTGDIASVCQAKGCWMKMGHRRHGCIGSISRLWIFRTYEQ